MQEVCLWKDILVGKEVTPRHRIAWRLTRNWVSCLSSRQLWAKPCPVHFFFLKYCQLSEHLSEDGLFLHWVITYLYSFYYKFLISQSDTRVKWVCYSLICHGSLDKENYLRRIQLKKTQMNLIGWPQNSSRWTNKNNNCFFCYQGSYFGIGWLWRFFMLEVKDLLNLTCNL